MKTDAYRQAIAAASTYQTPPNPARGKLDKLFGGLDSWYYGRLFSIVVHGSMQARRGTYTHEVWVGQSMETWALVEACGGRMDVSGLDHVRATTEPCVYVSNHMSLIETFLLPAIVASHNLAAIVIKEELLETPFFGRLLREVNPICVTRKNPRQDLKTVLQQGATALAQGRSVLIFPQSTRTTTFDPEAFNSLGTKLAGRAGVPLLPIALKTDFMGIGRMIKDFGRINRSQTIHIKVGAPLTVDGKVREAQAAAAQFIADHVTAWGGTVQRSASGR